MEDSSDDEKDYEKDGVFEEDRLPEESEEFTSQEFHQQQNGPGGRERELNPASTKITTPSTLAATAAVTTGNFIAPPFIGPHTAPNSSHPHWEHPNKENSPEVR